MKRGFQKCGKQPTKFELDCGVVSNLIRNKEISKAIDYCKNHEIDEETFVKIVNKVEKESSRSEYFGVVATYKDGSKSICKGKRATAYSTEWIDKNMLYKTYAAALKGKTTFENGSNIFGETYVIEKFVF